MFQIRVGSIAASMHCISPVYMLKAAAFPIDQTDARGELKTRRGEDWRRSGANATTKAVDKPTLHVLGHYIKLATLLWSLNFRDLRYWGQDDEGAYRAWPLKDTPRTLISCCSPLGEGPSGGTQRCSLEGLPSCGAIRG